MLNLHDIVRGPITFNFDDEAVIIYRAAGMRNVSGEIKTIYEAPEAAKAQIQSFKDDELYHAGWTGQNETTRRCYLYSAKNTVEKPASIIRPLARTGDMLSRLDGTWWLVTALKEDFSYAGWVNVAITLQVNPPDEGVILLDIRSVENFRALENVRSETV